MRPVSSQTTIGREEHLRELDDALASALAGEPRIVVLAGEAGVGKTRLVGELERRASDRGFAVLHGESVEFGGEAFPYAPVVAALRDVPQSWLDDALEQLDDEGRDGFATLLPPGRAPPSGRRQFSSRYGQGRLCELVLHVLDALAGTSAPVLVVLEDVHWADRSSRDLIAFLARNLRAERIALVVTYRTGELAPGHPLRRLLTELVRRPVVTRVDVGPLSRSEVALQLEAIAGRPVRGTFASTLHERSGGNPFFVEELFAAGVDEVPDTLADAVLARVQRLPGTTQRLLAIVAAAGARADHAVLAAMIPGPALGPALREALDAGLLVDAGGVALRHGLIGEVVYGSLVPAERRDLHAELGAAMAASGAAAAQLADQWYRAGAHDDALAASVEAGLDAVRLYAFAEAATHFDRALELWTLARRRPRAIDHVDLLSRAAQAARYTGARERAVALGRRALAELDTEAEPVRAARLYERLGEYASWDDRAALACYEQALGILPPGPLPERARLLAAQGHALMGMRRWEESRERCEAALAAAADVGDDIQAAAAGITLGLVLAFLGEAIVGEARLRAALATAERGGAGEQTARGYVHLGELLRLRGAHADALETMLTGERIAARLGMRASFGHFMYVNAADDMLRLGRWDDAAQRVVEAERLELGTTAGTMHHATAGHLYALRGDAARARAHLGRADELAGEGLPGEFVTPIHTAKAALALAEGDPDRARDQLDAAHGALHDERDPLYTPALLSLGVRAEAEIAERGRARRRMADVAHAKVRADALLAELAELVARSRGVPDAIAHHATAEAEYSRLAGSSDAGRWEQAASLWADLCEPHPAAYAGMRRAQALLATGADRSGAAAVLAAADATAEELGAAPLRAEVSAIARRARLRLAGTSAVADGLPLTRRETEVLKLLAEGLTNRQIAERLFISEKTVGTHVGHIFEKLDVHSRAGAAGRAHELGVLTST